MRNVRLQAAVLAGFFLFTPLAPLWSATMAAKSQPRPSEHTQKQEKRVRGQWDMADGQIKDVTCKGRAMSMTFDDYEAILHLHTNNYFKVKFSAIDFTPKGTMNPCKQAKGMYARVYYYHIKGHPHEGDLISVELRK